MSFKVSQSKLKTWRGCRRAYHYKYVEKLRKKVKSRPLEFGTIVHRMIEAWGEGKDPFKELKLIEKERGHVFRAEVEEFGDIIGTAEVIMDEYFDHWSKSDLRFVPLKGRKTELEFEVDIGDGITATGKIDAVGESGGLRWLVEHKTFGKQMPNEDERWRNLQSGVYLRIADMLGLPHIDGTLWDYIRSKPPTVPQMLKSGKLSKKSCDTLPSVVLETLAKHKLPRRDYQHMLDSAQRNRRTYFQRILTPRREEVVDQVFADFVETSKEMRDCHGVSKARSVGRNCSFCDYEPLCRAELLGHDADFLRRTNYEISRKPGAEDAQHGKAQGHQARDINGGLRPKRNG